MGESQERYLLCKLGETMELMVISTVASDVDTCSSCNCMLIFVLNLLIKGRYARPASSRLYILLT